VANSQTTQDGLTKAITSVSERASLLVREEIELAKAEVKQKVSTLSRGAGVAVAFGVFALFGVIFLLQALAWLLWKLIFSGDDYWGGFLIVAALLFAMAGISAFLANKWLRAKPAPTMATEEAKLIRDTVVQAANPDGASAAAASAAASAASGSNSSTKGVKSK